MLVAKHKIKVNFYLALAIFIVGVFIVFGLAHKDYSQAAINKEINYQAKLLTPAGDPVEDGQYNVTFKLYTADSGGSAIWTEELTGDNRATVTDGLFSTLLGSTTPLDVIDFNQTLYLGVEIGGSDLTPSWDGEMYPRKRIGSVPTAFESDKLDGFDAEQFLRSDEPDTMSSSSASTLLTVQQDGAGNIVNFMNGSESAMIITSDGSIGMGTITPTGKLDIVGNGNVFNSVFYFNGTAYTNQTANASQIMGTAYSLLTDTNDFFYVGEDAMFNEIFIDIAAAAGINEAVLAAQYSLGGGAWGTLAVTDGTAVSGSLRQDGSIAFTPPSDWAVDTVNGASRYWVRLSTPTADPVTNPTAYLTIPESRNPLQILTTAADTVPALSIDSKGAVLIRTLPTDPISANYSLYVTGTSYFTSSVMTAGDFMISGGDAYDNSGDFHMSGEDNLVFKMDYNNDDADTRSIIFAKNTTIGTGLPTPANELMRITETGYVGIGTTTPAYKLDVYGDSRIDGALIIGDITISGADGAFGQVLKTDSAGALTWQDDYYADSLNFATTTGFLTIGLNGTTTDLTYNLDGRYLTGFTEAQTLADVYALAGNDVLMTGADGNIRFHNEAGNEVLFLDQSTGNVGVGASTSLAFKLQVDGSIGPDQDDLYAIGSATNKWQTAHFGDNGINIYRGYADAGNYSLGNLGYSFDTLAESGTNNSLDFDAGDEGLFTQEDLAYAVSLTPSATSGDIILTLGSGNWDDNPQMVRGVRITGNSGEVVITDTDLNKATTTATVVTAFANTNAISSGSWHAYGTKFSSGVVSLNYLAGVSSEGGELVGSGDWAITETTEENYPEGSMFHAAAKIDNEHYLDVYTNDDLNRTEAKIYTVNPSTYAIASGTSFVLTNSSQQSPAIVNISDDYFLLAHRASYDSGSHGYLSILSVSTATDEVSTSSDPFIFSDAYGLQNELSQIGGNFFLHVFQGLDGSSSDYGVAEIIEADPDLGAISTTTSPFVWDYGSIAYNNLVKIDDTHYFNFYGKEDGVNAYPTAIVLEVSTSTPSISTSTELFRVANTVLASTGGISSIDAVAIDANHILVSYADAGFGAHSQLLEINLSTWEISAVGSDFSYYVSGAGSSLVKVDSNHIFNLFTVYIPGGTPVLEAKSDILEIDLDTWEISTSSELTINGSALNLFNNLIQIDNNNYFGVYSRTPDTMNWFTSAVVLSLNDITFSYEGGTLGRDAATPIDRYYSLSTTDSSRIDCQSWTDINNVDISETLNSQDLNYAVSFDDRTTWYIYSTGGDAGWRPIARDNSGTWQYNSNPTEGATSITWTSSDTNNQNSALSQAASSTTSNRMTGAEVEAITSGQWSATNGFATSTTSYINIASMFNSDTVSERPQLSGITFSYDYDIALETLVLATQAEGTYEAADMEFKVGDISAMYIDSATGNIGIGARNPSLFALQIDGDVGPNADNQYSLGSATRRWEDLSLGAEGMYIYNSYTSADNYERGYLGYVALGGGSSDSSLDFDAVDESQFSQEDMAYATTLTPSAITGDIILTLGSGNWNTDARVKKGTRVTGNGGVVVITEDPSAKATTTAEVITNFTNTNAILSGAWHLYGTIFASGVARLSASSGVGGELIASGDWTIATSAEDLSPDILMFNGFAKIDDEHYVVSGGNGGTGVAMIYEVDMSPYSIASGTPFIFATDNTYSNVLEQIGDTNSFLTAYFFSGDGNSYLDILDVDINTNAISTSTNRVAFLNGVSGSFFNISEIDPSNYLLVYMNETASTTGVAQLIDAEPGVGVATTSDPFVFDSGETEQERVVQIDDTHYLVTYVDRFLHEAKAVVLEVDLNSHSISTTTDILSFSATSTDDGEEINMNSLTQINENHYLSLYPCLYAGPSGCAIVLEVDTGNDYALSLASSEFIYEAIPGLYFSPISGITKVDRNHFLNLYGLLDVMSPTLFQTKAQTLEIDLETWEISTTTELIAGNYSSIFNNLINIDNNNFFANYSRLVGSDWYNSAMILTYDGLTFSTIGGAEAATGTYYTLATTDTNQINSSSWGSLSSFSLTQTLNSQTINYALSFDDRLTWKIYDSTSGDAGWRPVTRNNGGTWQYNSNATAGATDITWTDSTVNTQESAISQAMGITSNRMIGDTLSGLNSSQFEATGGWSSDVDTIDVAVSFYSTSDSQNPSLNQITLNYTTGIEQGVLTLATQMDGSGIIRDLQLMVGTTSALYIDGDTGNVNISKYLTLSGTNSYLNFGTTTGSEGYGLRDNNGTLQFKIAGGSWGDLGSSAWEYNGDDIFFNTGNVGIGTDTPLARFDVNGDMIISGSNRYLNFGTATSSSGYGFRDNSGVLQYKNSAGSWTNFFDGALNEGYVFVGNSSNEASATSSLFIDSNGSIGVGTTSPLANLDIYGNMIISGTNRYLNFGNTAGTTGHGFRDNSGTLQYKNSAGSWADLFSGALAEGSIYVGDSSNQATATSSLFIDDNSFVGIGTTSPLAKMDVFGNFIISGANRYLNFDGISGTSGYGIRDNAGVVQAKDSSGSWIDINLWQQNGNNIYYTDGNVGIGTSSPSLFKLQVAGDIGPDSDDTYSLGSQTNRFKDIYLGPDSIYFYKEYTDATNYEQAYIEYNKIENLVLDFSSSEEDNFIQEDLAPSTSVTPGAVHGETTLTLGSGNWSDIYKADIGMRLVGNGGQAKLVEDPPASSAVDAIVGDAFANTNTIASGDWQMYGTDFNYDSLRLSNIVVSGINTLDSESYTYTQSYSTLKINDSYMIATYDNKIRLVRYDSGANSLTNVYEFTGTAGIYYNNCAVLTNEYFACISVQAGTQYGYTSIMKINYNIGTISQVTSSPYQFSTYTNNAGYKKGIAKIDDTHLMIVYSDGAYTTSYVAVIEYNLVTGEMSGVGSPTTLYNGNGVNFEFGQVQTSGANSKILLLYQQGIDGVAVVLQPNIQTGAVSVVSNTLALGTAYEIDLTAIKDDIYYANIAWSDGNHCKLRMFDVDFDNNTISDVGSPYTIVGGGAIGYTSNCSATALDETTIALTYVESNDNRYSYYRIVKVDTDSGLVSPVGSDYYYYGRTADNNMITFDGNVFIASYIPFGSTTMYIGLNSTDILIPTDNYYTVTTGDNNDFDITSAFYFDSAVVDEITNGQVIYHSISFDGRDIWKIYDSTDGDEGWRPIARDNSGTWQYNSNATAGATDITWTNSSANDMNSAISQAVAIGANQMAVDIVEDLTYDIWMANGGATTTTPVNWAVSLYSSVSTTTPEIDQITVNYHVENEGGILTLGTKRAGDGYLGEIELKIGDASALYIDQYSNIGLGTTSPKAKLDVAGSLILNGANRYVNFGNQTGYNGYGIRDNNGNIEFKNSAGSWSAMGGSSSWTASGTDLSVTTYNVGIGTTSPLAKLDVYGDVMISGSNHYLNFGSATSSAGYGFRDNAGVMEFRDTSGSWTSLSSLASADNGTLNFGAAGSLAFYTADGTIATGTAGLAWDSANERLKVDNELRLLDSAGEYGGMTRVLADNELTVYNRVMSNSDSYSKLLLHFDGADNGTTFTDSGSSGHSITPHGGAVTDTDRKKFGTAAGLFDGTTGYLTVPDSSDWDFGTGDVTVDAWIYTEDAISGDDLRVIATAGDVYTQDGWYFMYGHHSSHGVSGTRIYFGNHLSAGDVWNIYLSDEVTVSPNAWHHIAAVRSAGTMYFFLDGVAVGSVAAPADFNVSGSGLTVGAQLYSSAYYWFHKGTIEEFRISKGIARWTSGFSVPTSEYAGGSMNEVAIISSQDSDGEGSGLTTFGDSAAKTVIDGYYVDITPTNSLRITGTTTIVGILTATSLGIGTSSPDEALTVNGLAHIWGTGTSTIEDNLHVKGALKVGDSSVYITADGIRFTGDTTYQTGGAIVFEPGVDEDLSINLSGAGDFMINNGQFYVDTSMGLIGIGTTSANSLLDVFADYSSPLFTDVAINGTNATSSTQTWGADDNVFDNNTGSYWATENGAVPGYIGYDFGNDSKKKITRYRLFGFDGTNSPDDWYFQGSNDGINWTTLDSRVDQFANVRNKWATYDVENIVGYYRYYRIYVTQFPGGGNSLIINEIEFFETDLIQVGFGSNELLSINHKGDVVMGDNGIVIDGNTGYVGLGTADPSANLEIYKANGSASDTMIKVATSTGIGFKVMGDGEAFSDKAFNSSGADYAEYFFTNDTNLQAGEAVCLDVTKNNTVKRCDRGADTNIMGIVSTNPAVIGNYKDEYKNNPSFKIIGMMGQVPAKVSTENGEIRPGDSLTSASSTAGYLMKALAGDSTVGVALEGLSETSGEINVLISRRNKSLTVEQVEQEVTERIAAMELEDEVNILITKAIESADFNSEISATIDPKLLLLETKLSVASASTSEEIVRLNDSMRTLADAIQENTRSINGLYSLIGTLQPEIDFTNIKLGDVDEPATATLAAVEIIVASSSPRTALVINQQSDSDIAEFNASGVNIMNVGSDGKVSIVGELMVDGRIMVCSGGSCGSALDEAVDETMGDMGVEGKVVAGAFEGYCEDGYVWVNGSSRYGTMPGFCLMQDKFASSTGAVWTDISLGEAQLNCQKQGNHLVTENEWLTVAENISRTMENDIDEVIPGLQLASSKFSLGSSTLSFILSNGNLINSLAGQPSEWTDRVIMRSECPRLASSTVDWQEYYAVDNYYGLDIAPAYYLDNDSNGIGLIRINPASQMIGFVRGENGIYSLDLSNSPATATSTIGFRCAK